MTDTPLSRATRGWTPHLRGATDPSAPAVGALQEQLAQVGVDIDDEALDTDLTYLRELELIELSGEIGDGAYRLTIPLMADWIEQQQDADVIASRARVEAEQENA